MGKARIYPYLHLPGFPKPCELGPKLPFPSQTFRAACPRAPVASPASGEEEEEGAETFLPPRPSLRPALPPLSQMVSAAPCQASKILPMGSSPSFPAASLPGSAPFSLNLLFVPEAPPQRLWGSLCPFPFGEQIPQPPGAWQFGLKLVPFEDLLPLLSRR